jgi:hypothetical protein
MWKYTPTFTADWFAASDRRLGNGAVPQVNNLPVPRSA